jgi:hypothetical protein
MAAKQTDPQYKLRIPADLKERIERSAEQSNRSINAEILSVLHFAYPPEVTLEELSAKIRDLVAEVGSKGSARVRKDLADALRDIEFKLDRGRYKPAFLGDDEPVEAKSKLPRPSKRSR